MTDDELLGRIREGIKRSPSSDEGHRKVTARLRREDGIGDGRKRVLLVPPIPSPDVTSGLPPMARREHDEVKR